MYLPPSGAPGFKGEEYDWDKGFSQELERELSVDGLGNEGEMGNGVKHGEKELVEVKQGNGKGKQVASGVGGLMEKRSGGVELKGRREGTMSVLESGLAALVRLFASSIYFCFRFVSFSFVFFPAIKTTVNSLIQHFFCSTSQIRPHLPALSRLPRTWTLLYSLDQHGISLNTLYTCCEAQLKVTTGPGTAGALVVMKDANDGVFGAWMGEGVGLIRGRGYYGSGES